MLQRTNTNVITARRAEIVLASAQGMKVPDIARKYYCSEEHVRDVIRRFNAGSLESLKPRYSGGRPVTFTPEQRSALVELALTPPQFAGFPWTSWSLSKLQEAAIKRKIVKSTSLETIRQVLDDAKVSYQRTKTWKESNDPEFEAKKRIKALYETPPPDGRVICIDEFGPLEIRPQFGQNWRPHKKPNRLPATYRRPHGVRYMFSAYDVHGDLLYGHIKHRKQVVEALRPSAAGTR